MLQTLLTLLKGYAVWACIALSGAFLVLLVSFYHYRFTVAQERLQAVTKEVTALTSEIERSNHEQAAMSTINTKAATAKVKSKVTTDDAKRQTHSVGTTQLTTSEYDILYNRANQVRSAALAPRG